MKSPSLSSEIATARMRAASPSDGAPTACDTTRCDEFVRASQVTDRCGVRRVSRTNTAQPTRRARVTFVDRLAPLCFSIPGLTLAAAFGVLRNIIRS